MFKRTVFYTAAALAMAPLAAFAGDGGSSDILSVLAIASKSVTRLVATLLGAF